MVPPERGYERTDRLRLFMADNAVVLSVVFAGLLLTGGWLGFDTRTNPGTTSEQRVESAWNATTEFEHAATVERANPVYPIGTDLENRSVYFTNISAELEGAYVYEYTASETGNLTVATDLTLVTRSVGNDGEQVFWRTDRSIGQYRQVGVSPGEQVRGNFTVDMRDIQSEISRIEDVFGATVGTRETVVVASLRADGTVNGQTVTRTQERTLTVSVSDATYRVSNPGPSTESFQTTSVVAVENEPDGATVLLSVLLACLGLVGLALVGVARVTWWTSIDEAERTAIQQARTRATYDEWITPGRLPHDFDDSAAVEVATLGGLVDIAIDTNARVIEAQTGAYYVLADQTTYVYRPEIAA